MEFEEPVVEIISLNAFEPTSSQHIESEISTPKQMASIDQFQLWIEKQTEILSQPNGSQINEKQSKSQSIQKTNYLDIDDTYDALRKSDMRYQFHQTIRPVSSLKRGSALVGLTPLQRSTCTVVSTHIKQCVGRCMPGHQSNNLNKASQRFHLDEFTARLKGRFINCSWGKPNVRLLRGMPRIELLSLSRDQGHQFHTESGQGKPLYWKFKQTSSVKNQYEIREDTPRSEHMPKNINIRQIQPRHYDKVRKEFKWWPLEDLQRVMLKKYNESEDEETTKRKRRRSPIRNRRPTQMKSSVTKAKELPKPDPLNQSISLAFKCSNYLEETKQLKKFLARRETSYKEKIEMIELGEEEEHEQDFANDQKNYEKNYAQSVVDEFKIDAKHFRAFKTFNPYKEKRFHAQVKKIVEVMQEDQHRISQHKFNQ